jgi:hypothetical protein
VGLNDVLLKFTPYVTPTGKPEPNWTTQCFREGHGACNKRRGATPAHEAHCGKIECVAFLQLWHEIQWPSKPGVRSHAAENPTTADVIRYCEDHRAELEDICRRAGH